MSNLEGDSFDPNLLNLPAGEGLPPLDSPSSEPAMATAEPIGKGKKAKQPKAKKEKKVKEPKVRIPRPAKASDGRSLWTRLAQANPYSVLLGIGVGALVIAILFMLLQLWAYDFALKPTR